MKGFLLDTNLLIALLWPAHQQHDLARQWYSRNRAKGWATCSLTESGFVRIVSNPVFSRDAPTPREAIAVLRANTVARDHQFWSADVPLPDLVEFTGVRLVGHQQLTDAYLLGLAVRHKGKLATFDHGIAALCEPKSEAAQCLDFLSKH